MEFGDTGYVTRVPRSGRISNDQMKSGDFKLRKQRYSKAIVRDSSSSSFYSDYSRFAAANLQGRYHANLAKIDDVRQNCWDLTQFDIDFDGVTYSPMRPEIKYSGNDCPISMEFRDRAIAYLTENAIKIKRSENYTDYVIPVIGQFCSYDVEKNKFIYLAINEDGIEYSSLGLTVTYGVWNISKSIYFKKMSDHSDKYFGRDSPQRQKYGRKPKRAFMEDVFS